MGHPAERNLEKDIKTLIKGQKIELDKSDEFIEMIPDYADIKNQFVKESRDYMKNNNFDEFERSFMVLVEEVREDVKSGRKDVCSTVYVDFKAIPPVLLLHKEKLLEIANKGKDKCWKVDERFAEMA